MCCIVDVWRGLSCEIVYVPPGHVALMSLLWGHAAGRNCQRVEGSQPVSCNSTTETKNISC